MEIKGYELLNLDKFNQYIETIKNNIHSNDSSDLKIELIPIITKENKYLRQVYSISKQEFELMQKLTEDEQSVIETRFRQLYRELDDLNHKKQMRRLQQTLFAANDINDEQLSFIVSKVKETEDPNSSAFIDKANELITFYLNVESLAH